MKSIILFFLVQLLIISGYAQTDSSILVFQHANVIDGISNGPLLDVTIIVTNGKISRIKKKVGKIPNKAVVIDLKEKWLLPGYIDAHVHFGDYAAAVRALFSGATTVRTMHCDHFLDVQIRKDHEQGRRDLPDVIAAGYQIRPDMFPSFFEDFPELSDMKPRIIGAENVRRVVRALVSRGVNHIKFLATERAGTAETDPRKRTFSDEEIAAIIDEAKKHGMRTAAHAHGDEGAYAAVNSGVTSIEHGTWMSDSTLAIMKKNKTYFVPTFTGGSQPPSRPEDVNNPILAERRRVAIPLRIRLIKLSLQMKIPIVAGTDLRYTTPDLSMADEGMYLYKAGLSPMQVIKAMTYNSAQCLGIQNRTGAIRKGYEADILILNQNPLLSPDALKDIRMIINDGKIITLNEN